MEFAIVFSIVALSWLVLSGIGSYVHINRNSLPLTLILAVFCFMSGTSAYMTGFTVAQVIYFGSMGSQVESGLLYAFAIGHLLLLLISLVEVIGTACLMRALSDNAISEEETGEGNV